MIVPPSGYYEKVQAILNKHNILFWADEVINGFGRTGNDFGCTTMNIQQPDMMSLAKQLSSAYVPISAAVIKGDMYEAMIEPSNQVGVFGHGYTYSGHPLACAVALKTLEIYERDSIFEKASETGKYFQTQLRKLSDHTLVGEVRGEGLLAAIEMVADKETDEAFKGGAVGAYCQQRCQEHGLIVRAVAGSSIAFCPPLIITQQQVDELIQKAERALDDTLVYVRSANL